MATRTDEELRLIEETEEALLRGITCPRCNGSGVRPHIAHERVIGRVLVADLCPVCHGEGRIKLLQPAEIMEQKPWRRG